MEFNSFTPNLLASGADEGEICIWDISRPAEPTHFPPLKVCSRLVAYIEKLVVSISSCNFDQNYCYVPLCELHPFFIDRIIIEMGKEKKSLAPKCFNDLGQY